MIQEPDYIEKEGKKMSVIEVAHLTKDYGHGRGVFDVSIDVNKGECYGFLGPNGAGKTTTIRHLMGFSKPDKGSTAINGLNSWEQPAVIQESVGYLPGEIALPSGITGTEFLNMMKEMRHMKDDSYYQMLLEKFELDPDISTRQMSLGVKRKLAVVTAFMHDPEILILDEPTTGLDPLMRDAFLELIREEKAKGRTIFMSSHIFEEIEHICDKVAMIKDGRIVDTIDLWDIRHWNRKTFDITFLSEEEYNRFTGEFTPAQRTEPDKLQCRAELPAEDIPVLFNKLKGYSIASLRERHITLEQYFRETYGKGEMENE